MEAVAAMDFNALSRRELQALCKLNGVRANVTNLAMVEALLSLPSVDGIDQIGTTLCLPTPGKSAMKSALRAATAVGDDQQQQGSSLPRGRRVSVKSPEAIRMDVEDEMKRDFTKEIVRTPGVALRSTSRRPRATPAPIPTPAAGTLRRSQRSTARKATAPVEVEVATTKRSTRKTAKLNMAIDFDQDEEDAVAREQEKAQEIEPKGVTSDVKCDDPEDEEVTELLEVNSKADEPEQGEEVVSSFAAIESVDKSCDNSMVEEAVEEPTKLQEGAAIEQEQKLVNADKFPMEDSPILGVLSKVVPEPAMKNIENASTEDGEGFGTWSPVLEIADEINSASEDKEDAVVEVPKEDGESAEEYDLNEKSSDEADLSGESSEDLDEDEDASEDKEDAFNSTVEAAYAPNKMIPAAATEKEITADEFPQADPQTESAHEYDVDGGSGDDADLTEESSEEDDLDDEDMENVNLTVDGESDATIEASNSTEVNFDSDVEEELKMLETGEEIKEYVESDSLTGEEDDFSADLSSEFDSVDDFSDAETERKNSPVALEGIHAAAASSAAKTDDSAITEEGDEVSQHVETVVESLDKVAITEEKKEECAKKKKQMKVGKEMSLRKLKSAYKESLIAAKEGKKLSIDADGGSRMALAELDDNVEC
ncbi:unnamed protein product [Alopecurus aequalis]